MEESRIRVLMAKKISNTADADELAELADLLSRFPAYHLLYKVMSQVKTNIHETPTEKEIELQLGELWKTINRHSATPAVPLKSLAAGRTFRKWMAAAAILVVTTTAGILVYRQQYSSTAQLAQQYKVIKCAYGQTARLTLPDGTVVKVNSGSTFSYPRVFAKNSREVSLEGEAFFEVTKNPHRPFLVHAGHLTVRVLGTAFNVKAYPEEKNIETTLIHGKVQVVMDNRPDKKIILLPNQKLTIAKEPAGELQQTAGKTAAPKYKLEPVGHQGSGEIQEIAWLDSKVAFSNQSFGEVAKVIERKYNVHIVFEQEQLRNELITGVFETENLAEALHLLQMTTDFSYTLKGDEIRLTTNSKHP